MARERGERPVEDVVYLHPGVGAPWKRWPAARFAALAERLVDRGYPVALVEGPADEEAVRAMQSLTAHPLPVLRETPLPALAETIAHARLYIGNDSGVTHLAAAAGVPTVALFGPTDPTSWAPRGDVLVLRQCDTRTLQQGQIRVCSDAACMESLTVEAVLQGAERLLTRDVDNPVENRPPAVENDVDSL
jgi:ADP-heptose:LPS heptosyltransferase